MVSRIALVLLFAGCSLDWSVRAGPGSSRPDADASAPADASADAAPPVEAGPDAPAADCAALASTLGSARTKARECQVGQSGQCTTTVKDECNCDVVVRFASSAETNAFGAARDAYAASCAPDCSKACPQLGPPGGWACLVQQTETRCVP